MFSKNGFLFSNLLLKRLLSCSTSVLVRGKASPKECTVTNLDKNTLKPQPPWKTLHGLVNLIKESVVYDCEHFVVINKPARLTCFPYQPSMAPATGDAEVDQALSLSLAQCLPELHDHFHSRDELFITQPLEPRYSGLVVISKTKLHRQVAQYYYRKQSTASDRSKCIYQHLLCLCWGPITTQELAPQPLYFSLLDMETGQPYKLSPAARNPDGGRMLLSYQVPALASKRDRDRGFMLSKRVGHKCLNTALEGGLPLLHLVRVDCNTTYCAVVELHLLHQGLRILGEQIHSSRLTTFSQNGTISPILLPPERATLFSPLPENLRGRLRIPQTWERSLPVLAHRYSLLVPLSPKSGDWDPQKAVVKRMPTLQVVDPELPEHFSYCINKLRLQWPDLPKKLPEVQVDAK